MKSFGGNVLFLDRSDINTDEIIPAKYLTEITKAALAPHLLEDLDLPGFDAATARDRAGVVVTRSNFGCGSSREHAVWALEVNGIHVVIAESFARIFRQNMYNCGLLALELPAATVDALFRRFATEETTVTCDLPGRTLQFQAGSIQETVVFQLQQFDAALVHAGGWVEFADSRY
jgi:3-isopropylmalate/(R)-2-methylmalate dehydratase small subunit